MKTDEPEFIIGRHPAVMALKSDQEINKVFIQKDLKADIIGQIVKLAKKRHLVISNVPKNKLDQMTNHQNHQGLHWQLRLTGMQRLTICLPTPKNMKRHRFS